MTKLAPACLLAGMVALGAGCSKATKKETTRQPETKGPAAGSRPGASARTARSETAAAAREGRTMALKVSSSVFEPGKRIPKKYAYKGEGDNISPPLSWTGAPEGTKSFVVLCEDPDAPSPKNPRPKPWVHWVLYDIPPDVTGLAEGKSAGVTGRNDFGETAWGGPLPPPGSGTHRYFFKVYALDTKLNLPAGATRDQVLKAMEGHILAQGEVYGTYER